MIRSMKTPRGLSTQEATRRQTQYGKNTLHYEKIHRWYQLFFAQFKDLMIIILMIASIISFALGEHMDSGVILFVVLLNACIGFFQEYRSEKTLEALKNMVHPEVHVIRDGQEQVVLSEDIVPGDYLILREGDRVPADGVIQFAKNFKLDESVITGESVSVLRQEGERTLMGTGVAKGLGHMLVEHIGMDTEFGKIARLTLETGSQESLLQRELKRIGIFVSKMTFGISFFIFVLGVLRNMPIFESFIYALSVAIAAVPEGLNTTIVIALALGASVLAKKNAVIKKLPSLETLGAVSMICSDKTGTLTKNEMMVREIYLANGESYRVSGVGYNYDDGEISLSRQQPENQLRLSKSLLKKVVDISFFCNDSKLLKQEGEYVLIGDPTEGALLSLAYKSGDYSPESVRELDEIFPFDAERKMMSVYAGGELLVKGSPDQVLTCTSYYHDGEEVHALDEQKRHEIYAQYEHMANRAYRVLAVAERVLDEKPSDQEGAESQLVFVGLVGMIDPPRLEVKESIELCHEAGIRTIVVTGDFGITAAAIARELGIIRKGEDFLLVSGDELAALSDDELKLMLAKRDVSLIFARTLPAQKMRIVAALEELGEVVAMTGDGVNDAPALKKAHVGIAMGITGTDVSKEASDMLLLDDSFASIVGAVAEGRRIYANLKKFIWYIFSSNIGELVLVIGALVLRLPLPLTAILILLINLGTDILPAIALGVDGADENTMKVPPRKKDKPLLTRSYILNFILSGGVVGLLNLGAYVLFLEFYPLYYGIPAPLLEAQSFVFVNLVLTQLVMPFLARSQSVSFAKQKFFENHFLLLSIFSSFLLVLVIVYVPLFNTLLHTAPLGAVDWVLVVATLLVSMITLLLGRYLSRLFPAFVLRQKKRI